MRLLLDTHTLLWALQDTSRLSRNAAQALAEPAAEMLVSPVSAYEIHLKYTLGKLPGAKFLAEKFDEVIATIDCRPLPITLLHASRAGTLDLAHRDPFDRLLMAQSLIEGVPLVSNETIFDQFGVERIW